MGDVTQLLAQARDGSPEASRALFERVYGELKAIASRASRQQPGALLNTTGLVHECFLRLADGVDAKDRGHFFALAARAMRQILCDQARRQLAAKRGGGAAASDEVELAADLGPQAAELVDIDRLLERLSHEDERAAKVMECRVFGGFTVPETADALGVSERTVHLDYERARAWFKQAMQA